MPKLADVRKDLATKQQSLRKTEADINKLNADFKVVATAQQKAEADAKKERDPGRKRTFETLSHTKRAEGDAIKRKIAVLEAAKEKFEVSIPATEQKIQELVDGIAAFGKARTDYLAWWPGAKARLDALVNSTATEAAAAEKALADCDKAIDEAKPDIATAKAAEAEAAAARAEGHYQSIDALIGGWKGKEWATQRNLKGSEFGVDNADALAAHGGLATRVYATFKEGDDGRADAKQNVDAAKNAAIEATTLAAQGSKSAGFYEELLTKMKGQLDALVAQHTAALTEMWGNTVSTEGANIKNMTNTFKAKPNDPGTRTSAVKTAEQATDMLPKALARAQRAATLIGQFVRKETQKVPPAFQRTLKAKIDEIKMEGIKVVNAQKAWEAKYQKTLAALAELEAAIAG